MQDFLKLPGMVLACLFAVAGHAAIPGVPSPPQTAAASYFLFDHASGEVLAEHDADVLLEPASLAKIMTVYVVADELSRNAIALDDVVTVSEKAWRTGGSKMFIEVDKQVSVNELLHGVIIQSGNDASIALAEHVSGDESVFVSLMNQHAARVGMKNSHFANSTGLPEPDMLVTARDMAILSSALIRDFPEIYSWFSLRDYTFNGIKQDNRNSLLGADESVDGIKTGHTEGAGYCLVSSARRGDMRLIAVVMGTDSMRSRTTASQALLNYGFRFFESHRLYDAGASLIDARVWKGDADAVRVGLTEPLFVTVPRGRHGDLQAEVTLRAPIIAPVTAGTEYGQLEIRLDGHSMSSVPLIALDSVEQAGLLGRLHDQVLLMFE